ncbi:MAG: hypothetical protein NTU98_05500 [Bacteroidetes bacterium]|nr:hypothetical protein [Bacteroidota bacterium]
MKTLYKILAWICTAFAAVLMLLSIVAFLAGGRIFNAYWNTYYWSLTNFLMFAVVFLLFYLAACKEKKE